MNHFIYRVDEFLNLWILFQLESTDKSFWSIQTIFWIGIVPSSFYVVKITSVSINDG